MDCREYKEIISAHVDGALSAKEVSETESHLHHCPNCARMFAWETRATKTLKQSLSPRPGAYELKQKILGQLDPSESRWSRLFLPNPAWAPALLVLFIFGSVFYWGWPFRSQQDLFAQTAGYYQRVDEGSSELLPATDTYLTARILDLTPWGYALFGKDVQRIKGLENRVFAYQGLQKELLVAQELDGEILSAPRGSVTVRKLGIDFVTRSIGNVNLVAWQDEDMVCVIASKLPADHLLALAAEIARQS